MSQLRTQCLVAALLAFACHSGVLAISCAGCVDLDELNFDQTIARFPYALIKFDIAFPYGEKHEAYAAFSKAAHKVTDELLVGTVGIKDYGEMENKQLGLRFKVDEKSFPGIFLFRGSVNDYMKLPSHLDVTVNNLKQLVTDNTQLFIGRDGCLKDYEQLAKNYANLEDAAQLKVIAQAEQLASQLQRDSEQQSAHSYLTYMHKINEKGYEFVEDETKRLQRLRASKVSEGKKTELTQKLNILESFRVGKLTKTTAKPEL